MAQTLLGFDFGRLRIGVAVGNTVRGSADPLVVIPTEPVAARWKAIAELVEHWQPQRLVVGRPGVHRAIAVDSCDDTPPAGEASRVDIAGRCERFARQLAGRFSLPVELVDEDYSSLEAGATLAATRRRPRGRGDPDEPDDAEAAAIILRQYLSSR